MQERVKPAFRTNNYGGALSREDCLALIKGGERIPQECDYILRKANLSGIPRQRSQRAKHSWKASEGHDVRKFYHPEQGYDKPKSNKSVDDLYLNNKSEAYKSKVKTLRTRMSIKGAKGLSGVNAAEVNKGREQDLQKRKSRRSELKKQGLF